MVRNLRRKRCGKRAKIGYINKVIGILMALRHITMQAKEIIGKECK